MSTLLRAVKAALLSTSILSTVSFAEPPRNLAQEKANQTLVLDFYEQFFNKHRTDVAEQVVSTEYKQHNPTVPDGRTPFVDYFAKFYQTHPAAHSEVVRSAAIDDLVYVHLLSKPDASSRGSAILNIFRVKGGKIVEHWDIIQPVPAESANANGMFDDVLPRATGARDVAQESANLKTVLAFYDGVFNQHKVVDASGVIASDYIQHNPGVPDGKAPFVEYFTDYFKTHPDSRAQIVRSVAQNDLVWLHVHSTESPNDRGQAVLDIFRVKDGKIVEHWDVIQDVPEKSANQNTMF
ncbi:nuclear transport factor 2 family protein [Pseudomonas sp. v388]|uniref:nuclear transport factor 2 family protein n=1 Tax=Pseudomonas sp. v388 TaxID=2479849 RepID=UPI001C49A4CF|nr:nuclear transport factor 2 family protein [Pseudomonas sp. v388]